MLKLHFSHDFCHFLQPLMFYGVLLFHFINHFQNSNMLPPPPMLPMPVSTTQLPPPLPLPPPASATIPTPAPLPPRPAPPPVGVTTGSIYTGTILPTQQFVGFPGLFGDEFYHKQHFLLLHSMDTVK